MQLLEKRAIFSLVYETGIQYSSVCGASFKNRSLHCSLTTPPPFLSLPSLSPLQKQNIMLQPQYKRAKDLASLIATAARVVESKEHRWRYFRKRRRSESSPLKASQQVLSCREISTYRAWSLSTTPSTGKRFFFTSLWLKI